MSDIYDEAKALAAEMLAPRSQEGGNGLELSLVRVAPWGIRPYRIVLTNHRAIRWLGFP
ncbi:hypothetical protein [Pseudomonas gorinensis]